MTVTPEPGTPLADAVLAAEQLATACQATATAMRNFADAFNAPLTEETPA